MLLISISNISAFLCVQRGELGSFPTNCNTRLTCNCRQIERHARVHAQKLSFRTTKPKLTISYIFDIPDLPKYIHDKRWCSPVVFDRKLYRHNR